MEQYGIPSAVLDGWSIAVEMTKRGRRIANAPLRYYAEKLAAEAIVRRAARLVGPMKAATRIVRTPLDEPYGGDLDVEATLENILVKPHPELRDYVVEQRLERRHQIVLMVDASLSMAGEKTALAAVATAVLALKLRSADLAVVTFGDRARTVTRLEIKDPVLEVVRRLLDQPVDGSTNITAALKLGAAELERGRNPRRSGLIITDGIATLGGDPVPYARLFPRLFVLHTEDLRHSSPAVCRGLAEAGHGRVFRVRDYSELPRRLLDVADMVLR